MKFKIIKKSKKSSARLGYLETEHGVVETPAWVPVATNAVIKTLTSEEVLQTNSQILICNTFHLHLKPGEKIIKSSGQLHRFMNWPKPLLTDSGGFQVFSLGFGRDLQVGKILGYFPGENNTEQIQQGHQPKEVKITHEGVWFNSPYNGEKLFLGPKESIKIQEALGADIMFAFDECTPPLASESYVKASLTRTHAWAKICLKIHSTNQALYGIIQGSRFKNLRQESSQFINALGFDGFGIGGDLGQDKKEMTQIIKSVTPFLDEKKPRHLLGIGWLEDIEAIIKMGMDTFDCTVPTQYARRGIAFTSGGKLDLRKPIFLKDQKPLDPKCACQVCSIYKRNYITHLIRAKEITPLRLITFHNICFFNAFVSAVREKIKKGQI